VGFRLRGPLFLIALVVLVVRELLQDVRGVGIPAGRQAAKLIKISSLACEFDEYVRGVGIPAGREAAKLVQISALAGEFYQLGDGILIPGCRLQAQHGQILIGHDVTCQRMAVPPLRSPHAGRGSDECTDGVAIAR
jgi:hypothetical protein